MANIYRNLSIFKIHREIKPIFSIDFLHTVVNLKLSAGIESEEAAR